MCRFSEAWGKMIHEKNLKLKILWHCPFKAKHQRTQECTDVTKLYKNHISWDYPFKKQSEWIFEKKYTRIYFSIQSFHKINYLSSLSKAFSPQEQYLQNHLPLLRSEGGNCRQMPHNFFSSAQFQRKRKSLVFFQSIYFLCPCLSLVILHYL